MKDRKTTIISITFMLLISIATAGCGGFYKGQTGTIQTYDFRKGTEGLAMTFLEGMPPKQLYVGTEFSTGIRIKNMGAYDIADRAQMKISTPPNAFMYPKGDTQEFTLTGKSLYAKDGQENIIMFPMKALCYTGYGGTRESTIIKNYTAKIKVDACYYYETTANADICIDTMKYLREKTDKPVCNMQDVSLSGGQGGPVGVVTISPLIVPSSQNAMTLQLGISVKKLQGTNYKIYSQRGECGNPEEQNKADIEVEMGGQKLWCEPYQVQLRESNAVGTTCKTQVDPALGAFKSPITVSMKYFAEQSILRDIVIEPPPGGVNCQALGGGTGLQGQN